MKQKNVTYSHYMFMTMKFSQLVWVLLLFLISQVCSSETPEKCMTVTDSIVFDELPQITIRPEFEPIKIKKRLIHDEYSKLTHEQKYFVYAGVYPLVEQYCHTQCSFITRLITHFVWCRLPEERSMLALTHSTILWCQFSADAMWLVMHCKNLTLWDVASNRCQWSVLAHKGAYIYQVILSSDDQYIISGSYDTTLEIRAFLSGHCLHTLRGHTGMVGRCALSADNQWLLSASSDHTIRVWSVRDGRCTHILAGHSTSVYWADFYAHGQRIVSAAGRELRLWAVASNHCERTLHGHTDDICACNVSADQRLVLSTSQDGTVRVWELDSGRCTQTFRSRTWVTEACFVRGDTEIAAICRDRTVCIWSVRDGQCVHRLCGNYKYYLPLPFSYWLARRDLECIIVATENSPYEVHVLSVETGETLRTFTTPTRISAVCVSSDGQCLITGSVGGIVNMFVFSKHTTLNSF